jgi:hypothetical protein
MTSVTMTGILAEIWTELLPNTNIERYRYASLLGDSIKTDHGNQVYSLLKML